MKLNILNLNQFKCFMAVAESGTLITGAKRLHLTTSAVYQSIQKLELELKTHLFYHSGKKYFLSPQGKKLAELLKVFFNELESFSNDVHQSMLNGTLRVGMPLNFSKNIFIPIFKKFSEEHPGVQLELSVGENKHLTDRILKFELDFAILDEMSDREINNKIAYDKIYQEELILLCSSEFYQKHKADLNQQKSMCQLPHLCYEVTLSMLKSWHRHNFKRQASIPHFHILDNVESMMSAIEQGLGLGVVPKNFYLQSSAKSNLKVISPNKDQSGIYNNLMLAQGQDYIPNLLVKNFLIYLRKQLK